jgi:hypothetical protein
MVEKQERRLSAMNRTINLRSLSLLPSYIPVYLTVEYMKRAMCVFGDVMLVRDEYYGVPLPVQLVKKSHYFLRRLGVQITGRFIGKNNRRVID